MLVSDFCPRNFKANKGWKPAVFVVKLRRVALALGLDCTPEVFQGKRGRSVFYGPYRHG